MRATHRVVDTRAWMQKFEQSQGKDTAAVKVKADWEPAARMSKTLLPFAINFQPVFTQPLHRRMMGLYPDNPLSGRVLREATQRPGLE